MNTNNEYSLKSLYETLLKEASDGDEKVLHHGVYERLKNPIIDLAQVGKIVGYNPKDSTQRSLFRKKARKQTIDGVTYGLTKTEINQIEKALSSI